METRLGISELVQRLEQRAQTLIRSTTMHRDYLAVKDHLSLPTVSSSPHAVATQLSVLSPLPMPHLTVAAVTTDASAAAACCCLPPLLRRSVAARRRCHCCCCRSPAAAFVLLCCCVAVYCRYCCRCSCHLSDAVCTAAAVANAVVSPILNSHPLMLPSPCHLQVRC